MFIHFPFRANFILEPVSFSENKYHHLLVCRVGDVDVLFSDVTSSDDEFEHRLVAALVLDVWNEEKRL